MMNYTDSMEKLTEARSVLEQAAQYIDRESRDFDRLFVANAVATALDIVTEVIDGD